MGSNFRFDITSDNPEHFRASIQLAFAKHASAVGYAIDPGNGKTAPRLILYWTDPDRSFAGFCRFPSPVGVNGAVAVVSEWLKAVRYDREPDHDGDNKKGFRVFNEEWGHVCRDHCAFVGVEPAWIMYGK